MIDRSSRSDIFCEYQLLYAILTWLSEYILYLQRWKTLPNCKIGEPVDDHSDAYCRCPWSLWKHLRHDHPRYWSCREHCKFQLFDEKLFIFQWWIQDFLDDDAVPHFRGEGDNLTWTILSRELLQKWKNSARVRDVRGRGECHWCPKSATSLSAILILNQHV